MRSAAGAFALLLGFLAVEIAMVQAASGLQLDGGGDIAIAVLVAVPLLAGTGAAAIFSALHSRSIETSDRHLLRSGSGDSARSDLTQLLRLTLVGCVIGIGAHTSPWVTAVGVVAAAGVALGWAHAYWAPARTGGSAG